MKTLRLNRFKLGSNTHITHVKPVSRPVYEGLSPIIITNNVKIIVKTSRNGFF